MSTGKTSKGGSAFFFTCTLFCLFLFSSLALAGTPEIDQIKSDIYFHGAQWEPGETSMTQLPPELRAKRLGFNKEKFKLQLPANTRVSQGAIPPAGLPVRLDYTTDYEYVTPVKDQGSCGSCWAFATTAALESQVLMATQMTVDLSEQILLSCSSAGDCESGGYPSSASTFIRDTGLPLEECYLYTTTGGSCSNAACPDWHSSTYGINGWHWVATTSPTVAALKSALAAYGPLVTTFDVYNDFFSYRGGIYSHVSGELRGGHAVELVGYDDADQCFIVKNSWGTGWGENGFFRIAYSQLKAPPPSNDPATYPSYGVGFGEYTIAYDGYKHIGTNCTYSILPVKAVVAQAGGYVTVRVTTQSGCSWEAAPSKYPLFKIVSVTKTATGGTVRFHVLANTTGKARTRTFTIAGQTFTIVQKATAAAK